MRNVLVLGGTAWLGPELVRQLVANGDAVTCLARGTSGAVPDGARLVAVDRRAPDAYEQVRGPWDEVIELTYEPDLVTGALDALAADAAHWTLVSSVSVYADDDQPGAGESAPLVEPIDTSEYAAAKVAAERASTAVLGDRLLIARAGLIVGPGDPSDRFGYWPARLDRGGQVLVPTTADRFVQVIDVRDLAAWIVRAGAARTHGAVNAVGEPVPMRDFLDQAVAVAAFDGELIPLDDGTLLDRGVQYWAGPRSLPLWLPSTAAGFAQRSHRAFRQSGGTTRPLSSTLTDVLADERARGIDRSRSSGLTPADEAEVLRDP